jgi:hypothetical protein
VSSLQNVPDLSRNGRGIGFMSALKEPSGHVFRVDRARGPVFYAKYRLPDGRQVQKKIGPAWAERGRPPEGYFTKRTAEVWLQDVLAQTRRGALRVVVRQGFPRRFAPQIPLVAINLCTRQRGTVSPALRSVFHILR